MSEIVAQVKPQPNYVYDNTFSLSKNAFDFSADQKESPYTSFQVFEDGINLWYFQGLHYFFCLKIIQRSLCGLVG